MAKRIVILASGVGTNAIALIRFAHQNPSLADIVGLLSDNATAPVLEAAKELGVEAIFIPHNRQDEQIAQIRKWGAEWACLAGYMRIVSQEFLDLFREGSDGAPARVLNIHPSLLPAYPGLRAYQRAYSSGISESGITVHFVDEKVDHGPIVLQEKFSRLESDTLEAFIERGKAIENQIYVRALDLVLRKENLDDYRRISNE